MFNIKEGIVICDNETKMNILKERNSFINYKFYSLKQLKDNMLGNIKNSAKYYLFKKYNYSLDYINTLFEYIHYVDINSNYESEKLSNIKKIKIDLIDNNYYIVNNRFKDILKRFNVTFINTLELKENLLLINLVKEYTNVDIVKYEFNNRVIPLFNCLNQEEELINYIELIINNNLDLNKVVFTNFNSDYLPLFKKLSYDYKIDFNINNKLSLISNRYIKYFLENLDLDFNELMSNIFDNDIKNKIINVINKYEIDVLDLKNAHVFLKDIFRKEKYDSVKYLNAISVTNDLSFSPDYTVFFLNFNVDVPTFKNNTYLSDEELEELNMSNILEYNKLYKDYFLSNLTNIDNLYLSFPINLKDTQNLESTLKDELNLDVRNVNIKLTSSYVLNKQILTNLYDDYVTYNKDNELLSHYNLDCLHYNSYDNSFKKFKTKPVTNLRENLKLSYTSTRGFYECPFKYYLDHVLKVKKYTKLLSANIGTYAHHILEHSYDDDFDFDKVKEEFMKEAKFSPKEEVFALFMDDVLRNVLAFNEENESVSDLTNVLREENIDVKINDTMFTGFIDKILYKEENNNVYVAIIDYKTGSDLMKLNNINDGLNLQLPVYTYLIKNAERFKDKNIFIVGLYLQKVEIVKVENLDKIYNKYKLQGFTLNDQSLMQMIEKNMNGSYVHNLKRNQNGTMSAYSKLIDDEIINQILELIPTLVKNIENAYDEMEFKINPYRLGDETGCKYCEYKRVCYKTEKDYRELEKESKGDDNGLDE